MTTHYLDEAEDADRICVINHGKIIALGTPDEIKEKLIEEYLLVDAADRTPLLKELDAKHIKHTIDQYIRIDLEGKTAQEIIKKIDTHLTHLEIHIPTLEDAYLEIIGDAKN